MKKKLTALVLAAVMTASLFSCSLREAGSAVSTDGAGRDYVGETAPAGTETAAPSIDPPDTSGSDTTAQTDLEGPVETGVNKVPADKVTYPTDFSFLDSVQKGHFSDKNPDDPNGCWYPGVTRRDPATGAVTYVWDRAADTLAAVEKYGAIYRGKEGKKVVYLTFDCGYEYRTEGGEYDDGVTNHILDTLKEKNAPGTFFVTGDYIIGGKVSNDSIIQRMLDEGHIIGNHTMHHYNMTTVTPEVFVSEIKEANDLLQSKFSDAPDMVFYRPPEGGANEWTLALANKMGLATTFWSATDVDYNPASQPDPDTLLANYKTKLHDGCVFLLHAVSVSNDKILPDLIDYIRAEGYEIAPLSEFE